MDRFGANRSIAVKVAAAVLVLAVFVPALGVGFAAWAGGRSEPPPLTAPQQILLFGMSGSPDTLDPHATTGTLTFQVTRSLYDTLVEPDESGALIPALASHYEVSESGLEWRFYLRHNVRFHHGRVLTAHDVEASLQRLMDPNFASPSAHEYRVIERVETPSDDEVVLYLSEPYAPLLATLASGWSAILPADLIELGHDFGSQPVGTGPFRFVRWVRDSEVELARFDHYRMEGLPALHGVRFRTVTEASVQAQALMAGQLHVADIVVEPELSLLRAAPTAKIYESVSALVLVMAINTRRAPLDRLEVRQAINAAIDKQQALDVAYGGGQVVGTFMDVANPYYVDFTALYPHDVEFARRVARTTQWDRELVIAVPQNFEPHVKAGQLYHEMLRQAGIPARLQLLDWSTWLSDVYGAGNFDLTVIGHTGKLDPHGRLARFGTADTYVGWVNAEAAGVIERAARVVDPHERARLYERALELMAIELPFVYVGSPNRFVGLYESVEGFVMDSRLDTADLRRVNIVR